MTVMRDSEAKHICHTCIGDQFLADQVKTKWSPIACSYCGETREAITLEDLADRIHEALEEHFESTPDSPDEPYEYYLAKEGRWERRGDTVDIVIAEMADLDEKVVDDVSAHLSKLYSYREVKFGGEDPYGPEAMYVERTPDDWDFREIWSEFGRQIRSRSRFFNTDAEQALNEIFGDLTTYKTWPDRPVIRKIGSDDEDRFIWRARTAQSTKELKAILVSPAREIGPPPPNLAKSGRMNAHGIPVFYGVIDESTCIAEVRAPVGSNVVVARFELLRPVQLLDLDALSKVYVGGSYFNPDYAVRKGRMSFLRRLVREISRPVMPQDEAFEYLTTQVVAEYLANKVTPCLDGIIFSSSQTGGTGLNVVLFNHASKVKAHDDLPAGTKVDIYIPRINEDDDEHDVGISIRETVPSAKSKKLSPAKRREGPIDLRSLQTALDNEEHGDTSYYFEPTLRLDPKSLAVLYVESVQYSTKHRTVSRCQETVEDDDQTAEKF